MKDIIKYLKTKLQIYPLPIEKEVIGGYVPCPYNFAGEENISHCESCVYFDKLIPPVDPLDHYILICKARKIF